MAKLNKEFFLDNEVLFVGYSARNAAFSKEVYKTFTNKGIKVYPLNLRKDGNYDVKVYNTLDEIKKVPATAYVLLKSENTKKTVARLAEKGVKRILFQNAKTVDQDTLDNCKKMGVETAVACPMMILGSGIHRIHAFFKGIR